MPNVQPTPQPEPQINPQSLAPNPESPVTTPEPPKKKPLLPMVIAALAVIVLMVGVAYAQFYQNKPAPDSASNTTSAPTSTETTTPQDPTANWQTYTNTAYNYTIKYPSDWKTQNVAAGAGTAEAPQNARAVEIYQTPVPEGEAPNSISIEYLQSPLLDDTSTQTVNGINMQVNTSEFGKTYYIPLPDQKGYLMVIRVNDPIKEQIFSTFQFTSSETSQQSTTYPNLKTYTNPDWGIQFQYPNEDMGITESGAEIFIGFTQPQYVPYVTINQQNTISITNLPDCSASDNTYPCYEQPSYLREFTPGLNNITINGQPAQSAFIKTNRFESSRIVQFQNRDLQLEFGATANRFIKASDQTLDSFQFTNN